MPNQIPNNKSAQSNGSSRTSSAASKSSSAASVSSSKQKSKSKQQKSKQQQPSVGNASRSSSAASTNSQARQSALVRQQGPGQRAPSSDSDVTPVRQSALVRQQGPGQRASSTGSVDSDQKSQRGVLNASNVFGSSSRPTSAAPAASSRTQQMSRSLASQSRMQQAPRSQSTESSKNRNQDLSSISRNDKNPMFGEFRKICNDKYIKGNPILAMFSLLNDFSIKHVGKPNERCELVLKKEIERIMSGTERTTSDDMAFFTRCVAALNTPKNKLYYGKGFDAQFFIEVETSLKQMINNGMIKYLETKVEKEGTMVRLNISGNSKSRAHWSTMDTFVMGLIGSEKYLTEKNLTNHISSSHKMTDIGMAVLNTIKPTEISKEIMKLIETRKIFPEIFRSTMVYRAITDNGEHVSSGTSKFYEISVNCSLGRIMRDFYNKKKPTYITLENDKVTIPFGNISNFIGELFTKQEENGETVRTTIDSNDTAFVALAVAFRFESETKGKARTLSKSLQ